MEKKTRLQIEGIVYDMLADKGNLNKSEIKQDSNISLDLGFDSLDGVELFMDIEKEFNLVVPDQDMAKLKTVTNVIDYIEAGLNTK